MVRIGEECLHTGKMFFLGKTNSKYSWIVRYVDTLSLTPEDIPAPVTGLPNYSIPWCEDQQAVLSIGIITSKEEGRKERKRENTGHSLMPSLRDLMSQNPQNNHPCWTCSILIV